MKAYGEILRGGDRKALAGLIRTLYLHRERQKAAGKKFHTGDEQLLDRAQKLLHEEFAYVLNLRPEDVRPAVHRKTDLGFRKTINPHVRQAVPDIFL